MIANIIIGLLIFGYAGWTVYRHIQKSKEGKCGTCELKNNCTTCGSPTITRSNNHNRINTINK